MRLVLFCFAGRQANLEVQRPFIDRILAEHPEAEFHLWDLTRTPEDAAYVRAQASDRIRVLTHLHPGHPITCSPAYTTSKSGRRVRRCSCMVHRPPYEKPYAWYAADASYADTVFIKLDDDVLFLETARLADLLDPLQQMPDAVISANVVNNVVCAKHDREIRDRVAAKLKPGDHTAAAADKAWWWLHTNQRFAQLSHDWFLDNVAALTNPTRVGALARSRAGERVSINTIAFTHPTMRRIADMIGREERLGDEGAVDRLLPRIATGFRVAHLTFGPQDKSMTLAQLDELRARYTVAAKEYLA